MPDMTHLAKKRTSHGASLITRAFGKVRCMLTATTLLMWPGACASHKPPVTTSSHTPGYQDAHITACSSHFRPGPYWRTIKDRTAAKQETLWVATLAVRGHVFRASHRLTPPLKPALEEMLGTLGVDVLQGFPGTRWLVVRGKPAAILAIIEASCEVLAFDLSALMCDCDTTSCIEAETCDLTWATVWPDEREEASAQRMEGTFGHGEALAGCREGPPPTTVMDIETMHHHPRGGVWEGRWSTPWSQELCSTL